MHSYRGMGVKTLFIGLFSEFFRRRTRLVIQMNPLAYDRAVDAWLDATAKEIKLTKFSGLSDIADQVVMLGHNEQELIIKPPRRGGFGTLRDLIYPDPEKLELLEIMGGYSEEVKTVVEVDGKRRTFSIGRNTNNALCEIALDEDIIDKDGIPSFDGIQGWVRSIIAEYTPRLYPGLDVEVA